MEVPRQKHMMVPRTANALHQPRADHREKEGRTPAPNNRRRSSETERSVESRNDGRRNSHCRVKGVGSAQLARRDRDERTDGEGERDGREVRELADEFLREEEKETG